MNTYTETEWRAYRADVAQTRVQAAIRLAPAAVKPVLSRRAAAALKRARKLTRKGA